jgi:hypothetical protein
LLLLQLLRLVMGAAIGDGLMGAAIGGMMGGSNVNQRRAHRAKIG